MKIVFLDEATISLQGDMDFSSIEQRGELVRYDLTTPEQIVERAKDAEVVVVNKVPMGRDILAALPNLGHIAVIATGYNNIDTTAARDMEIGVSNVFGYGKYIVPQHAFTLILNLASHVIEYSRDVQKGDWEAQDSFTLLRYPTFELAGKTIGIIGFGAIGRGSAAIAEGFGMKVLVNDAFDFEHPKYKNTPVDEICKNADIITIHCPLTDETRDLIGDREFDMMKRNALIVNTARGGIINEKALLKALEEKKIAGAGLDTLTQEPPRKHPLLYRNDLNLIVTPHSAWSAKESRQRLIDEVAENIKAFQEQRERNIVNR